MKGALIGLAALPFIASGAAAADRLGDHQLDLVTAGQLLGIECPGCTLSSSTSTSANGVTTTTGSTVVVGEGSGNGGSSGAANSGPSVVTSIAVPPKDASIISNASIVTVTRP